MTIKVDQNLSTPFKLFANCIPVKGYFRSIIVDIQRTNYFLIPNDLSDLLLKFDGKTINDIIHFYGKSNSKTIIDYFEFLVLNELIFFTKTPRLFPKIDFTSWKHPSDIYQAIIDIEYDITKIDQTIFNSLDNLNCKYIDFRLFKNINFDDIKNLLKQAEETSIIGINVYIEFSSYDDLIKMKVLFNSFLRVNNVFIYRSPVNKQITREGKTNFHNMFLVKEDLKGCKNCGIVSEKYFTINIQSFTKSITHNSCLSGKISISSNGEIKNCPSMKETYGNIKENVLEKAVANRNFKKHWTITKDNIKTCKDCEFRYICIDCRAYTENPTDIYSKPLKCGYDPYTGRWDDWTKNPLKQNAIDYYEMRDIIN